MCFCYIHPRKRRNFLHQLLKPETEAAGDTPAGPAIHTEKGSAVKHSLPRPAASQSKTDARPARTRIAASRRSPPSRAFFLHPAQSSFRFPSGACVSRRYLLAVHQIHDSASAGVKGSPLLPPWCSGTKANFSAVPVWGLSARCTRGRTRFRTQRISASFFSNRIKGAFFI